MLSIVLNNYAGFPTHVGDNILDFVIIRINDAIKFDSSISEIRISLIIVLFESS